MEESITYFMDKEHEKIDEDLYKFENNPNEESFNKFKWDLEKHFFVEEKAIFVMHQKIEGQEVTNIFDLMQSHGDIIELVKKVSDNLPEVNEKDLEELKTTLKNHHEFEDEKFYPELIKRLNDEQKKEIIEKIKEIVRT